MISEHDTKTLLKEFYSNADNRELFEKYMSETFFDVLGKSRSETGHNNFLKWFFSQDIWYSEAIKRLICIARKNSTSDLFPTKLNNLDLNRCRISNVELPTYNCCIQTPPGKKRGYADIVIDCTLQSETHEPVPLKIIVENKIDSPEHDNQTWTYYTYFSNDDEDCRVYGIKACARKHRYIPKDNEIQLFLYLSPSWNTKSNSSLGICPKFIKVSYQDLYDDVFKYVYDSAQDNAHNRQMLFFKEYKPHCI